MTNRAHENRLSPPAAVAFTGLFITVGWALVESLFMPSSYAKGGEPLDLLVVTVGGLFFLAAGVMWLREYLNG